MIVRSERPRHIHVVPICVACLFPAKFEPLVVSIWENIYIEACMYTLGIYWNPSVTSPSLKARDALLPMPLTAGTRHVEIAWGRQMGTVRTGQSLVLTIYWGARLLFHHDMLSFWTRKLIFTAMIAYSWWSSPNLVSQEYIFFKYDKWSRKSVARSDCWAWILWLLRHGNQKLSFEKVIIHAWRTSWRARRVCKAVKHERYVPKEYCIEWITESVFVRCSWWIKSVIVEEGGDKDRRDEIPTVKPD